ncbi:helix-turn-helix domain-containing protein [Psychroflexus aestuariivivens]|uniref:helix-turn-helix domain-containing protein n=1 Tax=Psychroflexus aestuariivivens TaxID=1795040 RepID=UPI000FD9A42A|nr:helix-turn-helix transcriptional regulator [Psychroflexus aestuariivivens]
MDHLQILKDSGLTKKKISEKLGVGERTIDSYFNGNRKIPDSTKRLIVYEFGLKQVQEKEAEYKTEQTKNNQLLERLKDKDYIIDLQAEHIQSLKEQIEMLKFQLRNLKKR